MKTNIVALVVGLMMALPVAACGPQEVASLDGPWNGAILLAPGMQLKIEVRFTPVESGFKAEIDIPEQGAKALALEAVRYEHPTVYFELPAGIGRAKFDGQRDGEKIAGEFLQGAVKAKFKLARGPLQAAVSVALPGVHTEVRITREGYELAGTFSLPEGTGPFPALIMVTGSGGQTRDEEVAGFPLFRYLAEDLLAKGIAVLRCDDRGVGASTGSQATVTTATNADDAEACFNFLRTQKSVDPARCGIFGHSEGGMIAPIVAVRNESVAFTILLAPSCVRGDELLFRQGELLLRAGGGSEKAAKAKRKLQEAIFHWMRTTESLDAVHALVDEEATAAFALMPKDSRGDEAEFLKLYRSQARATFDNPWMRFFIDYDPAATLSKVRCPTLALFGARDLQVPPSMNKPAIEAAFADRPALLQALTLPQANHLFQRSYTGGVQEYGMLAKACVDGLRENLSAFVLALPQKN
ncbi:MAG: alpha/beta hydrolase [Planctomycetes bacterium]|nr:alpha/beta hydrolase [Planctomycetota bacterium]